MLPSSNDHEDRWNKEQCSYRSEDQSSDYRSAQGAFCSPPSLRPNAIGIIPMIIAIAVMSKSQSLKLFRFRSPLSSTSRLSETDQLPGQIVDHSFGEAKIILNDASRVSRQPD
jgi:hypothetical protein